MVLPKFQDVELECWEDSGKLGFHPPFICLRGDSTAANVLLAATDELVTSGGSSHRTLTLRHHSRPKPIFKIRIVLSTESDDLAQMSITRKDNEATFEFTERGLIELRRALEEWRDGGEDFSVHPEGSRKPSRAHRNDNMRAKDLASGELWFWSSMSP
jgi:hypothetical protein